MDMIYFFSFFFKEKPTWLKVSKGALLVACHCKNLKYQLYQIT